MKTAVSLFLLLTAAMALPAAPITGMLWAVSDAIASDARPANIPGTPPDVTFDVNGPLNFNSGTTVQNFLNSGGAFNIVGSASALAAAMSPSLIEFTGQVTVTNGQIFSVAHDDGVMLVIGGLTVIGTSGPTSPVTTTQTYTGPSGTFPFTLVYGECCGAPAVLEIALPFEVTQHGTVPEPATLALAGGAMLALAVLKRRKSA